MSTTFASLAALLLYAALLAPLLFMIRSGRSARSLALVYAAGFAVLIVFYADFSTPTLKAAAFPSGGPGAGLGPEAAEGCGEAISVTEDAGVIIDRSNPRRIVVNRSMWAQLPQDAKDVLIACISGAEPGDESQPVEIVEQG